MPLNPYDAPPGMVAVKLGVNEVCGIDNCSLAGTTDCWKILNRDTRAKTSCLEDCRADCENVRFVLNDYEDVDGDL